MEGAVARGLPKDVLARTVLFSAVAIMFLAPLFQDFNRLGIHDWDQHEFYHAVPRETVLRYWQFPLWNPYQCGGNVMLANPQSTFLSPSFLLVLLFGVIPGLKLTVLVHVVIGMYGMYRVGATLGLARTGRIVAAFVFMLNGAFASHAALGHTTFLPIAFIPWVFDAYLRSFDDLRYVVPAAVFSAMMVFGGGVYPFVFTMLFLVVHAMLKAVQLRSTTPLRATLGVLVLTFLVASVKLVPLIEIQLERSLERQVDPGYTLALLALAFIEDELNTSDLPYGISPDQVYFWHEYYAYIGMIGLAASLLGAVVSLGDRWPLVAACLVIIMLSFGTNAFIDIWRPAHALPVIRSLRVPSRLNMVFLFCFAAFAGRAFSSLKRWGVPSSVVSVLVFVLLADMIYVNGDLFYGSFTRVLPPLGPARPFHQVRVPGEDRFKVQYPMFLLNLGVVNCYEQAKPPIRALAVSDEGYRGEVYYRSSPGTPELLSFSPNRLVIGVDVTSPDTLIVNQNHDPGWKVAGRMVRSVYGVIAVDVEPGDTEVILYYRPTSFLLGSLLTVMGLILGGLFFTRGPTGWILST